MAGLNVVVCLNTIVTVGGTVPVNRINSPVMPCWLVLDCLISFLFIYFLHL